MLEMTNGATFVYVEKTDTIKINEYKAKGYVEVPAKKKAVLNGD